MRAVLVLLVIARLAAADNGFVWDAPAPCPDGDDVRARIERRLGSPLEIHGIEVAITQAGKTFVAHVDTRGVTVANQIRTLTSARCDELADAVAVIVARLASEQLRAAPRPRVARVAVERPHVETSPPARAVVREWSIGAHALALSGIGMVPRVGVGGELAVFGRRRQVFAEVGVVRWATRSAYLVAGAPARVDVGVEAVILRAGWSPPAMPLRAWLGGELGAMRGKGASLAEARDGTARWSAVTAGFGVGWPMTKSAKLVGIFEVAVPLSRVHFTLAESGNIYSSSALSARSALGLEVELR